MKSSFSHSCFALFCFSLGLLHSGVETHSLPNLNSEVTVASQSVKDWTVEIGSGAAYSNVRHSSGNDYKLQMNDICFSYQLDEVSLLGWRRGFTEWVSQANVNVVLEGPETHMFGITFGPRYNFVQEGWKVIPFVGSQIGAVFVDSRNDSLKNPRGFGQDFTMTFQVESGVKVPLTSTLFLRLSAIYSHFSNGGLSEPNHRANNDIDALGARLAFGSSF